MISNKLYIEWINIFPITINNYKNTLLYKNTYNFTYTCKIFKLRYKKKMFKK